MVVESSYPIHVEVYSIQLYVINCVSDSSVVFSGYSGFVHHQPNKQTTTKKITMYLLNILEGLNSFGKDWGNQLIMTLSPGF